MDVGRRITLKRIRVKVTAAGKGRGLFLFVLSGEDDTDGTTSTPVRIIYGKPSGRPTLHLTTIKVYQPTFTGRDRRLTHQATLVGPIQRMRIDAQTEVSFKMKRQKATRDVYEQECQPRTKLLLRHGQSNCCVEEKMARNEGGGGGRGEREEEEENTHTHETLT